MEDYREAEGRVVALPLGLGSEFASSLVTARFRVHNRPIPYPSICTHLPSPESQRAVKAGAIAKAEFAFYLSKVSSSRRWKRRTHARAQSDAREWLVCACVSAPARACACVIIT